MERRKTRSVKLGNKFLGSEHDILIQSMTYTKTEDKEATLSQILALENTGCEIVRFSVPNEACAQSIPYLKEHTHIPLVADIHFDYKLALMAAERGIDKIRINPGNIGDESRVKAVVDICKQKSIPIRIGVNGGSLEKHILAKYGAPTPEALCESAFYHVKLLEKFDFNDIIVSIKSSDVANTIKANRLFAEMCDYPLHLGVTEAGTERSGLIKSSAGIGALLCEGIGDTLRVSLSDDVIKEVEAAKDLLRVLDIRRGVKIVSCPTCSRCNIDVFNTAKRLEEALKDKNWDMKIAVMGCAVNGPGEAREADIGIAGGAGEGLLFKKGEIVGKVPMNDFFDVLIREAEEMAKSQK
ncbi:MAG: flavodoxin-dependent (E)-4-hydroxy-3-methylbut-2-enyl-diphosphate synthase [Ruminococcaceae bacterium]|nr:flavodoxin-dependent (E)-4-hydroxy-3-methylbut-2-enyl-diphosphate synthase [Oscillospiraceae bacterium]